jgi:hypothetical protein
MIRNQFLSRMAPARGASFAALTLAVTVGIMPPAAQAADETGVYILRFAREVADGRAVVSTSHDTVVARGRRGDRSLILHDIQAGAVTIERAEGTGALALASRRQVDASHAYDYREKRIAGTGASVAVFNDYLRPLILQGPPPGQDASWRVATTLAALGLEEFGGAAVDIALQRSYLTNAGQPVVLIEFEIPAFAYGGAAGEATVHWARGFAVTDPSFSEIHAMGTQHRATVTDANGRMLPVSVRTSLHGIDRAGGWRMNFADAPAIRAAVDRTRATAGDRIASTTPVLDAAPIKPYPAVVAARLDFAALALGENGANPIPATLDAAMMPVPDAAGDADAGGAAGTTSAAPAESSSRDVRLEMLEGLNGYIQNDYSAMRVDSSGATTTYRTSETSADVPAEAVTVTRVVVDRNSEQMTPGGAGSSSDVGVQMLEGLNSYIQKDYSEMRIDPAGSGGYRRSETTGSQTSGNPFQEQLKVYINSDYQEMRFDPSRKDFTYRGSESSSPAIERAQQDATSGNPFQEQLNVYINSDYQEMRFDPSRKDFTYRGSESSSPAIERAHLDALVSEMARAAELEARNAGAGPRLTPVDTFDDGLPAWLQEEWDRNPAGREADDTLYRLLLAEMERERAETQRDERRREQRESSGIDSLDEFVNNNAFTYTSLVGVVETDLSRWEEWLTTQNVRELERLALLAGYPNLASALADAQNIIRQAQDPGYRRWAMQAPSCGGIGGCGPSYLERWHMKTSIVALGDILAASRDIFSTGGFSDIGISGLNLSYLLRDHGAEDGDIVRIRVSQFGHVTYEGQVNLTNAGENFGLLLGRGVASLEIYAVNEGSASPNTAQITVDNVVRGQGTQTYSLNTGQIATLRIEAGATAGGTP